MSKVFTHMKVDLSESMEAETSDTGRKYRTPIGDLPSVTTVVGWEKRKFFAAWRKENPFESKRVCQRGNVLHEKIEHYLDNEGTPETGEKVDDLTLELFNQLRPELDKIDNILALEAPLWSETTMLAGRVDCIAEYNGKLSIIDFKGSTSAKSRNQCFSYFLQATAYAIAFEERTGTPIDNFAILMTSEDGITQVFEGHPKDYAKSLLGAIEKYHADQG